MPVVVYAAPVLNENAKRFVQVVAELPGVALGLISQDSADLLSAEVRAKVRSFVQVDDALQKDRILAAVKRITEELGPVEQILSPNEQVMLPLAEARAELGLPGLTPEQAMNFRDKTRMKDLLRAANLPVARHCLAAKMEEAKRFAREVGYPVVVKPPLGVASQTTYRVEDEARLVEAVTSASAAAKGPVLVEEFLKGQEGSFDALISRGRIVAHSVTRYYPTPLEVMQNPWMQWVVVSPREIDAPEYDDIRAAGARALEVLGHTKGMCHLEWFRREDGTLAISEVGARPPGAQITTMISRAHEVDCLAAWAKLEVFGEFEPFPARRYATGAAYLRGQGQGRVRAVHGMDVVQRDVGHLITDVRLPQIGHEKGASYEGEGFVLVKHEETRVVTKALQHIVATVRVDLG